MSGLATAAIGGSIITGVLASNAAKKSAETQANAATQASNTQLQATREANSLQQWALQQQLSNQSPYQATGQMALAALQSGLGLGQMTTGQQAQSQQAQPQVQTSGPVFTNAQGQIVDQMGQPVQQPTASSPYQIQNYGATQEQLNQGAGAVQAGQFQKTFTPSDLTTDPSYQWRLDQGMKNLQASAAARGGLMTGQNLKDITDYSQGAGSQEYQNAYNRYMSQQDALYQRLAGLAGIGTNATQSANTALQGSANTMGQNTMTGAGASSNYLTSGAAAQAAGQVGSANAIGSGIGQGVNSWMTLQMLGKNPFASTPAAGQVGGIGNAGYGNYTGLGQ